MNILSEKPEIFCNELDSWVQKIISQKGDGSFFTLYVTLIDLIRSNFLNFEILNDLDNQLKERMDQLNRKPSKSHGAVILKSPLALRLQDDCAMTSWG